MKKRILKIVMISLSFIMVFTCFCRITFAKNEPTDKNIATEQTNYDIQPRLNGLSKNDWQIASETGNEIVLERYIGPETTEVIVPGAINGKQVYINGAISDDNFGENNEGFFDSSGRTELGLSFTDAVTVTSIIFQEVNGKKVKVKNHRLTGLFYNYDVYDNDDRSNYLSLTSIDGSGLDTTGVTDMACMFASCNNLTDLIGIETWDTSSVIDMEGIFERCDNLTNITPLTNWDVSSVRSMGSMFRGCSSLIDLTPIENWDISSVRRMK